MAPWSGEREAVPTERELVMDITLPPALVTHTVSSPPSTEAVQV